MEHVEARGLPSQPERIPDCVTGDARQTTRSAEREELELERLPAPESAEEAADVTRGSGTRLNERRDVDADSHVVTSSCRATWRTALRGSS